MCVCVCVMSKLFKPQRPQQGALRTVWLKLLAG